MQLNFEKIGDIDVVRLEGSLTVTGAQLFFSQMISLLQMGGTKFVVDLSKTDFIDSTGLGTIIRSHKRIKEAGGRLILSDLPPKIWKTFELTRLDKILPICDTRQDALETLALEH